MQISEEAKSRPKVAKRAPDEFVSFFDINQLELAFINRALKEGGKTKAPDFIEIGRNLRILRIQKLNLERLLRKGKKETREGALESELRKILSGSKIFSMFPRR